MRARVKLEQFDRDVSQGLCVRLVPRRMQTDSLAVDRDPDLRISLPDARHGDGTARVAGDLDEADRDLTDADHLSDTQAERVSRPRSAVDCTAAKKQLDRGKNR